MINMTNWNGWGIQGMDKPVPPSAVPFLEEACGPANPQKDTTLEDLLKCVPPSRLNYHEDHLSIASDPETRFHYSHGQSFPDWVWMRQGQANLDEPPFKLETGYAPNFQITDGVAFPESLAEIDELIALADKRDWNVIPHGGGTSVVGHLTPQGKTRPTLTVSMKKMNQLLELNEVDHTATFQSGVLGPDLEAQLAAKGYTLGHYPQSFEFSTLGGWIATRSSGQQSKLYGRIDESLLGCIVCTEKGHLTLPHLPASSAGPDLRQIVAGSEGRFGIIAQATMRVLPLPEQDRVLAFFLPDLDAGLKAARQIAQSGLQVSMLRLSNPKETEVHLAQAGTSRAMSILQRYLALRGLKNGSRCLCLVGVTGPRNRVQRTQKAIRSIMAQNQAAFLFRTFESKWQANRFRSAYMRNSLWDLGYGVDTLETALPWHQVPEAMGEVETAIRSVDPGRVLAFTHLSHIYETGSSMYTTYVFPLESSARSNLEKWSKMKTKASEAIISRGGTISHQHGVGSDHAPFLEREKSSEGIRMIDGLSQVMDPNQRFNPGKLLAKQARQ